MPTVQLIVTGKMEEKSLATSLGNIFNTLSFPPVLQFDGITSNRIKQPPTSELSLRVDDLAAALVGSVDPGRKGKPCDMAIMIDDLELVNAEQPDIVMKFFAKAVEKCILSRWSNSKRQKQCADIVKESCSFHLFVPMGEAYFFGEIPNALERAGANIQSKFDGSLMDVEKFQVSWHVHDNGINYLNAPAGRKKINPYWTLNPSLRAQHPKKYIDFICCPEIKYTKDNKDKFYKEYRKNGVSGTNALKTLNWQQVLSNPNHAQYLRALIHDIAEKFAIYPLPFPGKCASPTKYTGQGKILRNF